MENKQLYLLKTKRCVLRYFEEKDLLSIIEYRNNDEWMKYQEYKNLPIEVYRKTLLLPFDITRGSQLAISLINGDLLIGDIYIKKQEDIIYLGYTINPFYARKGYMSEVVSAYIKKLLIDYPNHQIRAETDLDNVASNQFLINNGFILYESNQNENVYQFINKGDKSCQ